MVSKRFKLFKIPEGGDTVVFVPALARVYRIPEKIAAALPNFVTAEMAIAEDAEWKSHDRNFTSVVLALTNKCNLQCVYCYGDFGRPRNGTGIVMESRIARAAIDYIVEQARGTDRKRVHLGLFGGEPTRAWELLIESVGYLRSTTHRNGLQSTAGIITNGFMNSKMAGWLATNLDGVTISFDGYKSIQDSQRSGSFERVFATAKKIYGLSPKKLTFRATVTESSVGSLREIVEFFGINFPGCVQRYEPLFPMGRGVGSGTDGKSLHSVFFDKFLEAVPTARKYGSKLKTSVLRLRGGEHDVFCGASGRNFLVTYDGSVVSCNRMMEANINEASDFFHYGRFDKKSCSFIFDEEKYARLKILSLKTVPDCENCFAQFSCKGDCPANKAVTLPSSFWKEKSYRCSEIRDFLQKVLSYVLDNGTDGLFI